MGGCVPPEEANVSARCGENEAYKDGICKCAEGYTKWAGKCVPLTINITCGEGYVEIDGKCVRKAEGECPEGYILEDDVCVLKGTVPECSEGYVLSGDECVPEVTECPSGYELIDGKCVVIEINATECPGGYEIIEDKCVPIIEECPEGYELEEGICKPKEQEPTCAESEKLKNGKCIPIIQECPEAYILEGGECVPEAVEECPDGYKMMGGACMFTRGQECGEDEVLEAGRCVSKNIYEDANVRPEDTGHSCVLASDCSGERAICSNGKCKDIPKEIYNEEYGGGEEMGIIIPEVFEETFTNRREALPGEYKEDGAGEMEEKDSEKKDSGFEERDNQDRMDEDRKFEDKDEGNRMEEERYDEGQKEEERFEEERHEEEFREEEKPQDAITGAFSWLDTALKGVSFVKAGEQTPCTSIDDCNPNQECDTVMEWCHCTYGWSDCNGWGDGDDADGCESEDPTCGGERELCQGGCGENQYCDEEKGGCQCEKGYNDCDGNWADCESEKQCQGCDNDDDCAKPVCAEWDNVVMKFGCAEGEGWEQENGVVSFSGGCIFKPTGKVDSYLNFDSWGESFKEVEMLRRSKEHSGGWCKFELESYIKERKELQEGLNEDFLKWFFDDYLESEPGQWENRMGGIFDIYWTLIDNARETARTSMCSGQDGIPPSYTPIDIEYESGFGKVHIWEEKKSVEEFEGIEVLSPYMEIWIFPPKEIFKQEMIKAREGGYMPGPPEDRVKEIGPSEREKEEMRNQPGALENIGKIADDFGGSMEGLLTLKDGDEDVFYIKAVLNRDVIFEAKPVKSVDFEPDVRVEVQMDFLYDIVKGSEQHGEVQAPPWDSGRRTRNMVGDVVAKGVIGARVTGAIATGSIKVKPLSAVPKILKVINMAMGGDRPGGPGDREREEE
ncbi:MAG: hypothetical protein ABIB71_02065 [Candidatus Woesearchaeota archaeon]